LRKARHKGEIIMEMSKISIRSRLAATAAAAALVGGATLATASPASGAAGAGGTTIIRQPVAGSTAVCNDGVLAVTAGALQIAVNDTRTPSGAYHLIVEVNAQGVKAVGPTGATYQLPGGSWMEMNVTPGATTFTETDVFNAIGQGSAPNFTVRGVVHTTVDANGKLTASVDHFTATGNCIP
jgi:hypothetical protein